MTKKITAPTITLEGLRELDPCPDAMERLEGSLPKQGDITAAMARECGATLDDLVWVACEVAPNHKDVKRRLHMWSADCTAHVLHIFEAERPADMHPREAIEAARRFANGDARAAAWATERAAAKAAWDAAQDAAWEAAGEAARAAARGAAWAAAGDAEEKWQFDRLVEWFSDNEPEPWPLPVREEGE